MKEAAVQQRIRLAAAQMGVDLWRNNTGVLLDSTGRPVRYGLANDSKSLNEEIKSSDLIGLTPTNAYIEGIGWTVVGIFTAIECKKSDWKFNINEKRDVAQKNFHDIVLKAGGYAGFATSVEDFKRIIRK